MRKRINTSALSSPLMSMSKIERVKVYPEYPYGKDVLMSEYPRKNIVSESIDFNKIKHFTGSVFNVKDTEAGEVCETDDSEEKYFFSLM